MTTPPDAHNPDKTQPLNAMPTASPAPSSGAPQTKGKTASAAKARPAQMELLKTPSSAAPLQHNPEKTQPLNAMPAATPAPEATPPSEAPRPLPAWAQQLQIEAAKPSPPSSIASPPPTPAQDRHKPDKTQLLNAAPSATPPQPEVIKPAAADSPKATASVASSMAAAPDIEQIRPSPPLSDRLRWIGHKITATAFVTEILPGAAAKVRAYGSLTRLDKPIGIWLLLWPVLWALWLSSGGRPDPHVFIVFMLGTVLTRSAGCAINDFADRNFDGHVQRTRDRPLVTGAVDPMEAIALCAGLGLIALGLALTLNQLAQLLALVGGVLVLTYPFFKRFFPIPQVYLGIAFTWSVPMAFAAQTGTVPRIGWVMFMSGLSWTVAYDTMYAMVDREDDRKLGIRSSALLFGDADRFIIGIMQLMTLLGLWLIGHEMELGLWYGLGLAVAAMFALYEQLLIRERKPDACFRAFLNNNYFGMSVFIGIVLEYTFR